MADESSDGSSEHSEESVSEPDSPTKQAPTVKLPPKPESSNGHPKTADMVNEAIKELAERGGSSLMAIKKFIAGRYQIDTDKQAVFIKKYLNKAVANGTLVQVKGKGANGSFKMPSATALAAQARQAKAAKAAEKAAKAAEKESKKKVATKTSSKKIVTDEATKASKKQASTKVKEKPSATEQKNKTVKATKKPPKSPRKGSKVTKSATSKKASAAKTEEGPSAADKKSKGVKAAKKMVESTSKSSNVAVSPTSKPKSGRAKKVVVKSPEAGGAKKTVAVSK